MIVKNGPYSVKIGSEGESRRPPPGVKPEAAFVRCGVLLLGEEHLLGHDGVAGLNSVEIET